MTNPWLQGIWNLGYSADKAEQMMEDEGDADFRLVVS